MSKLNLGCHNSIRAGYINIDKDLYTGVDMVCDVSKIDMADGSCEEIYSSNVLEHFPHTRTLEVLREWYRLLKQDGVLAISVPDFDRTIELYKKRGLCDWVINFLYGDQCYDGAFHYCVFNEERLTKLLKKAGFKEVSRVERLPSNLPDECSNNVSNVDGKLVSLNMVAIK